MNSGIYLIFNLKNGYFYIGSTHNFNNRCQDHFKQLRKNSHGTSNKNGKTDYLQNAFNKYGENNFEFIPVRFVGPDKAKLLAAEQEYLDKYFGTKECYNLAPVAGSVLGFKHSKESREKMKKSHIGQISGMKDKHHSEISKQKMRQAKIGKKLSKKHRKNLSSNNTKYWLGKSRSQITKDKISKIHIGNTYRKGKKLSTETRNKISEIQYREFKLISPNNIFYEGKNVKGFCKDHNLNAAHIYGVLNGKLKQYKGWKNEY